MVRNQYKPTSVSPPGDTLRELLEEKNMSQAELAERMGRPRKTINEIIQGKTVITSETALQLEHVLGSPASFWLRRESHYREYLARLNEAEDLTAYLDWVDHFPLDEMVKLGWLDRSTTPLDQIRAILRFFNISHPDQWLVIESRLIAQYRQSASVTADPYAMAAWLQMGEIRAETIETAPYQRERFMTALHEIRTLTLSRPEEAIPQLQERCAECGVAFVLLPALKHTGVSGASRWLVKKEKALIQLTLRYKTSDQFWFSFFHEAAHILLHPTVSGFVDFEGESNREHEDEANRFAAALLIGSAHWEEYIETLPGKGRHPSLDSIVQFSDKVGVHPGIVVGRLQHEGHLPHTHGNKLKAALSWDQL